MSVSHIIFDIETGPLADDELRKMLPPFEPPAHPGEFDPASVKYGNTKDEKLRAEKLAAAQQAHADKLASYTAEVDTAQAEHWNKFRGRAALEASTGRVVAIGYWRDGTARIAAKDDEQETLRGFWGLYQHCQLSGSRLIGFNCLGFDLPFLMRRSWLLGLTVPPSVMDRRWFSPVFVDLMQKWGCGGRDYVKLDTLAKAFDIGGKNGDGAMFAELWERDRAAAEAYLKNDLDMTAKLAERLGEI